MLGVFRKLADNREGDSLATALRKKRFGIFLEMIASLRKPIRILDVGGTAKFWEMMDFVGVEGVEIVLVNLEPTDVRHRGMTAIAGDARDLSGLRDREFDVVFSNSVIEHVGGYRDQQRMAAEVQRVGRRYFVQTPNRYFPIEPHFVFPLFQFLPIAARVELLRRFDLGWHRRTPDRDEARRTVSAIRLLSEREMRELFPRGRLHSEKLFGLTKSFIAYS
jgi:hypothetical protein